jgi:hypothetical protein
VTALHLLTEATCREGLWRYACTCTATFEGPDRDETVEAVRTHMSEPAYPSGSGVDHA